MQNHHYDLYYKNYKFQIKRNGLITYIPPTTYTIQSVLRGRECFQG